MSGDPLFALTYIGIGALIAIAIWAIGLTIYKLLIAPYFYGRKKEWRRSTVSAYYQVSDNTARSSRLLDVSSYYPSTSPTVHSISPAKSFNSMSYSRYDYNTSSSRSSNSVLELTKQQPILPPWESIPNYISPDKWFEFLTGTSEYEFSGSKRNIIVPYYDVIDFDDYDDHRSDFYQQWNDGPHLGIKNASNGRLYSAGMFYTASIRELSESVHEIAGKTTHVRKSPCKFIIDVLENKENERLVDPAYLQSLPENEDAMFQVASRFNCIEPPDVSVSPDKSNFVSKCKYIYTIVTLFNSRHY